MNKYYKESNVFVHIESYMNLIKHNMFEKYNSNIFDLLQVGFKITIYKSRFYANVPEYADV